MMAVRALLAPFSNNYRGVRRHLLPFLAKVKIGGTFWTKSELFLRKIQNRKRNAPRAFSRTLRGAYDDNIAPHRTRCDECDRPPKTISFHFFSRLPPDPSTEKERKVRKGFSRSGSLMCIIYHIILINHNILYNT